MKSYIGITKQINIVSEKVPNLDAKYGPFNSIEEATTEIPEHIRCIGLTVGIVTDNSITDYWWKSGIANADLVVKVDKVPNNVSELNNDSEFTSKTEVADSLSKTSQDINDRVTNVSQEFNTKLTDVNKDLNDKINSIGLGLIWKDSVETIEELGIKYPNPEIGWAAMVTQEGFIYSFNGVDWANTGLKEFPENIVTSKDLDNNNKLFFPDRSFSGNVNVDRSHMCNFNADNEFTGYVANENFDTAWIQIFEDSGSMTITGAKFIRITHFNSLDPTIYSYITNRVATTIPAGSKLALVTMRKTDNPEGYNNLFVAQPAMGVTKKELAAELKDKDHPFLPDRSFSNYPNIHYNHLWNIPTSGTPSYVDHASFDTAWVQIFEDTGKLEIAGAKITAIRYFSTLEPKYDVYLGTGSTIPAGAKLALIALRKTDNPSGYLNMTVKQDGSGLTRQEVDVKRVPRFIPKVVGKNLINPDDLLYGWTYSSSDGLIQNSDGILSNKLYLSPGPITLQGVVAYAGNKNIARILFFNDKDEMITAPSITLVDGKGTYNLTTGPTFYDAVYARLVLQYNTNAIFNPNAAQFEYGRTATKFERCKTELVINPAYEREPRSCFVTGASTSVSGNGWFENACRQLGYKHRNVAVSGENVMQHADKAWKGKLYTPEELEDIDIFIVNHVHNYDVSYDGQLEINDVIHGYMDTTNTFINSQMWAMDKYLIPRGEEKVTVSTIGSTSSYPFIYFYDAAGNIINSVTMSFTGTPTVLTTEVDVPTDTVFMYVRRRIFEGITTSAKLHTTFVQTTVKKYEERCYDSAGNLLFETPNPANPNHFILPTAGYSSQGYFPQNKVINEKYAAGLDYLLKKYIKDCYNLKDNPTSKYYGTSHGKPVVIVLCTQWHDGYVIYNNAIKKVAARFGANLCDFANNVGFSYKQTDPNDDNSIRQSALFCNNRSFGSGNDFQDVNINGTVYKNMGWHPTRDVNSYFALKRASILVDVLKKISF